MTTHCKIGDTNIFIVYKLGTKKETTIKTKNAPIEVITTTPPGNVASPTYEVITEITGTWRRTDSPQEVLSVRTIQFKNTTNQAPVSISFSPTTYRSVPNGFSFYGFETALLNLTVGTALGGANSGGSNGTSNIVSSVGNFDATVGTKCDALTNSARIVSVERIDGVCSIEALYNSQRLFKDTGDCPIVYSVLCDGDCPPGTVKCLSTNYPGYCCLPCSEIKNEIKAIASQVRSINNG